jgi:hypothetical protein
MPDKPRGADRTSAAGFTMPEGGLRMLSLTYQVARARQSELLAQAESARQQRVARRRLREQRRAKR